MEKLRDKKKHDHLLTKLLKASIFSIVMLAPFFAILSNCLYILNPSANQNYSTNNTEYRYSTITQTTQFVKNNNYVVNLYEMREGMSIGTNTPTFQYNTISIQLTDNIRINATKFYLRNADVGISIFFLSENNTNVGNIRLYNQSDNTWEYTSFTYNLKEVDSYNSGTTLNNAFYEIIEIPTPMNNAFYDAVNQIEEQPLFNWTKNTGLYTTLNAMCSGLDVGTNILAILLTYWALMTAIYIVFDIIIELFTKLTHILA